MKSASTKFFEVATVLSSEIHAENIVFNKMYTHDFLISHHTRSATMLPGDIISTGTAGAAQKMTEI
jgi:2-keto-4-pentenoate hydratase/2-oxohepta-3-ene-1,7-dioic acid hydratase in catechol pathway